MVKEEEVYFPVADPDAIRRFNRLEQLKDSMIVLQDFEKEGIQENEVFVDRPSVELKQKPYYLRRGDEREEVLPIFILDRSGNLVDAAEIKSSLIRDIVAKKLEIVRVYTFEEHLDKVRNIIEKRIYNE